MVFPDAPAGVGAADGTVAALGVLAVQALGSGSVLAAIIGIGALPDTPEADGEALDLDTGGGTSSPTMWVITETQETRVLASVTSGVLVSQTLPGADSVTRSDVLVSTTHGNGE